MRFDLLGSGYVKLGPSLPWHTDFKTGRRVAAAVRAEHRLPGARSPDRRQSAVGAQPLPALHDARPGLLADRRRALRAGIRRRSPRLDRAQSVGLRRELGVRHGRRAARRQLDLGLLLHGGSDACASPAFRGAFLRALYLHGEYVATHIERADVNGNHYLCDGVGLVFLGAFFRSTAKGNAGSRLGTDMIAAEIFNQTSEDGVDFEKSTAYHRLVLEAFLTCGVLLDRHGEPLPPTWRARLERMLEFVEAYVKPDGRVPLIGDADDGRIQKLGPQPLTDHRYLLSTGAALFGRERLQARGRAGSTTSRSGCSVPTRRGRVRRACTQSRRRRSRGRFRTAASTCCASERAHVVRRLRRSRHARPRRPWPQRHPQLRAVARRDEPRHRLRRLSVHGVARVAEPVPQHRVSQRRAGRRRGAEPVHLLPDNLWQLHDDARPRGRRRGGAATTSTTSAASHSGYLRLTPPVAVTREIALVKDGPAVIVRDSVDGTGTRAAGLALSPRPRASAPRSAAATSGCCGGGRKRGCSSTPAPRTLEDDDRGRLGLAELRRPHAGSAWSCCAAASPFRRSRTCRFGLASACRLDRLAAACRVVLRHAGHSSLGT